MNSIQKGSMTVVVSTVIASAAILMTGNLVADGNKTQKKGVEALVKNMPIDASVKESSISLSVTTPPPPSGPFLGDGSQLVGEAKEVLTSPKLLPSIVSPASQKTVEEPKSPKQPSAPSMPVVTSPAKASQDVSVPKAPVAPEKVKVTQPVNEMANAINKADAEKAVTPLAPKTPDSPVVQLEKPQKVAKEMIEPSKPEKAIDSFKPTAPEMEMTSKQSKQLDAPKLEKAISAPKVSSEIPKLQEPVVAKPQMSASQIKEPLAPAGAQTKKTPEMPKPAINVQKPMSPQNMNQKRPVMPKNMGNRMMPRQRFQQRNQQANGRAPVWQEKIRQQNNYQPRTNGSTNNTNPKRVPQSAQKSGQNRMIPPKGMYQYAPMHPSNYGYPQMPMWNGYYYQMMPYYWPLMPQKMPKGMPNTNVQKQGVVPPVNVQKSINGSSINGKK